MTYWTDKRVVVTGGAGFLGSHVVDKLREAGCRHVFVVRSSEYDLTSEPDAKRLFSELALGVNGWAGGATPGSAADIVIHLAGLVGGIGANKERPADFFYQNLMMGALTLHYAWLHGVKKAVAAGAGCGYPEHAPMPLREDSFWDGLPQYESSPYSLAKRLLQVQADAYWRQHQFPTIVTIPGNIYGPHDNFDLEGAHVIPALVRKFVEAVDDGPPGARSVSVWGTGAATRDFVYAGDVAEGILRAAEVYDRSELVNLTSGAETSIREVVTLLTQLTEMTGEVRWDASRPEGQARRLFDVSKANAELGWQPRTSLAEGLRLTVDWYREHRAEARNLMSYAPRRAAATI